MDPKDEEQKTARNSGGIWRVLWAGGCLWGAVLWSGVEGGEREQRGESWKSVQFCSCLFSKRSPTHTLRRDGHWLHHHLNPCWWHQSPQSNSRARQRPCWDGTLMKQILVAIYPWPCVSPPSNFQCYRKGCTFQSWHFLEVKSVILTQADAQWSDCRWVLSRVVSSDQGADHFLSLNQGFLTWNS